MQNKKLFSKIKKLMIEKKINQSDLAKELNITRGVVSGWFRGVRNPKKETIERLFLYMLGLILDLLPYFSYKNLKILFNKGNRQIKPNINLLIKLFLLNFLHLSFGHL